MRLENIVWDARDPRGLAEFWATALGAELITDEPAGCEARLVLDGGAFLDLCFPHVATPSSAPARLHLDLAGGSRQAAVVDRLLALGAEHADIGQGETPWVVLADPEGNTFCVLEERAAYRDTGPVAALPLDSADPGRDAAFWAQLTGWLPYEGIAPATLRHPAGVGPLLEFCPEPAPKQGKNRQHLDVRSETGDGDLVERAVELGARRIETADADLPWTVLADPSGNEFCVLAPTRTSPPAAGASVDRRGPW